MPTPGRDSPRRGVGWLLLAARWPLLVVYAILVVLLIVIAACSSEWAALIAIAVGLLCQAVFLVARGDPRLLRPVTFHRAVAPGIIAGLMAAVLLSGMGCALAELLRFDFPGQSWLTLVFLSSWAFWAILFAMVAFGTEHVRALRRVVLLLISGSLLQLLATVSAHITVMRRGGCLVGIGTGLGVSAGVAVLFWAFGPGIALLFIYHARRRMTGRCPGCGYSVRGLPELRCPECGRPFTAHEVGLTVEELRSPQDDV